MFNFIWMTVWKEKGFDFEFTENALARYLVISEHGEYVGSTEFKAYTGKGNPDRVAPFRSHPKVKADLSAVIEIDKVALLPEYRRKYTSDLLSACVHFAWQQQYHYMIALMEPVFYRALRITFRVPMEKVGSKTLYKGDTVIPVVINVKQIYDNPERFEWLNLDQADDRTSLSTQNNEYLHRK